MKPGPNACSREYASTSAARVVAMALSLDAWFGPLQAEYLDTYIPQGGGAVRFAVAPEPLLPTIKATIAAAARGAGLHLVELDTAQTKLHMLHTAFTP